MPDEIIPEVFSDQFVINISQFGVALTFGASSPPRSYDEIQNPSGAPPIFNIRSVVRVTPAYAKAIAMVLRSNLKDYETQNGEIILPAATFIGTEIKLEDW